MALQKSAILKTINVNHCRLLKFVNRSILNADGPPRRCADDAAAAAAALPSQNRQSFCRRRRRRRRQRNKILR